MKSQASKRNKAKSESAEEIKKMKSESVQSESLNCFFHDRQNSPLVSVVIPVYNVASYLSRCLDSVLGQTYSHIEVILVDDGSSDGSERICDEYAEKDERIAVIHKKNGGLSDARNIGLSCSNGEYLTFVDSDDYIADTYIGTLMDIIVKYQADIAICGYRELSPSENSQNAYSKQNSNINLNVRNSLNNFNTYNIVLMDKAIALSNLLYQKLYNTSVWGKMYHRDKWESLNFPPGMLYEDQAVLPFVFARADIVVYINAELYFYCQRSGNISHMKDKEHILDRVEHSETIYSFVSDEIPELINAANSRILASAVLVLQELPYRNVNREILLKLRSEIHKTRSSVIWDSQARPVNRIAALISYAGMPALKLAISCYVKMFHVSV